LPAPRVRTRDTPDEEARTRFRARVAREAARGQLPRDRFEPDDLDWAFAHGHEHELAELTHTAQQVPVAEQAEREHRDRVQQFRDMCATVAAEQDAERQRRTEAEARRRLGWKKSEQP